MSVKPLSPFSGQKQKSRLLFAFFIQIPIEPEYSEMDSFDKKKRFAVDLPEKYDIYTLYLYGSPVLTTKTHKKIIIQVMLNIFYILTDFFKWEGGRPLTW